MRIHCCKANHTLQCYTVHSSISLHIRHVKNIIHMKAVDRNVIYVLCPIPLAVVQVLVEKLWKFDSSLTLK
jgi:hypothetical protein